MRDYGNDAQIGLEETPAAYVDKLVAVFREVWRVLADDGVLWLNLGDSYVSSNSDQVIQTKDRESGGLRGDNNFYRRPKSGGLPSKNLIGIPWRVAFALQDDGWYLRSDVIWHKLNPMPESVTDRPTRAHEYLFLLTKQERYYYDAQAIAERAMQPMSVATLTAQKKRGYLQKLEASTLGSNQGASTRNKRSVWSLSSDPYPGAHFATMPPALVAPCILAGSRPGDTVLDPFSGSGTTGMVALQYGRRYVGVELNPDYIKLSHKRLQPYAAQMQLLEAIP